MVDHMSLANNAEATQINYVHDVPQLLVIQLLFDSGMRAGELMRLSLKDFDKEKRTIILRRTKGQVLRVIPYGEHIRTTLRYLKYAHIPLKQIVTVLNAKDYKKKCGSCNAKKSCSPLLISTSSLLCQMN